MCYVPGPVTGTRLESKNDFTVTIFNTNFWDKVITDYSTIGFRWHYYTTEVRSCQQGELVQATVSHSKDLIEKIDELEPGGTSELE